MAFTRPFTGGQGPPAGAVSGLKKIESRLATGVQQMRASPVLPFRDVERPRRERDDGVYVVRVLEDVVGQILEVHPGCRKVLGGGQIGLVWPDATLVLDKRKRPLRADRILDTVGVGSSILPVPTNLEMTRS